MTVCEKLEFVERVIHAPKYSLQEDTILNELDGWESLNIVNLQMELAARGINIEFMDLIRCNTVKDLCLLFD